MTQVKTIDSAFTRDWPNADCYVQIASGAAVTQRVGVFCSCAMGVCLKREAESEAR